MAGPWRSKRQQQDGSKAASAAVQRRSEAARSGSRRSERAAAAQRARACTHECLARSGRNRESEGEREGREKERVNVLT